MCKMCAVKSKIDVYFMCLFFISILTNIKFCVTLLKRKNRNDY